MTETDPLDVPDVVVPALLRAARGTYGDAIRRELEDAGCEDLPRNGPYLLGGMVNHGEAPRDLFRGMRVTKQAASQLVDTLVLRGYLVRSADTDDRRRITLEPTDRGRAAAAAVRAGVTSVDEELARELSPEQLSGFRCGLWALVGIRERREAAADG